MKFKIFNLRLCWFNDEIFVFCACTYSKEVIEEKCLSQCGYKMKKMPVFSTKSGIFPHHFCTQLFFILLNIFQDVIIVHELQIRVDKFNEKLTICIKKIVSKCTYFHSRKLKFWLPKRKSARRAGRRHCSYFVCIQHFHEVF